MNEPRLADYVLKYHGNLMSEHERSVNRHLTTLFKQGTGDLPAPGTAMETNHIHSLQRHWLSDDPRVIADAQAGWHAARQRIAERIVRDHPDEVYLNRCPACGALTASPTARICLVCPHTWFHVPRGVR
ncbi:hypothetical protein [Longimicrobium terrae]|uniref:Uncharacterized protein n=1 Tax=Longimicrobium terrae TaxID=1639882 RepID=A0A841GVE8_9BACT|nr:hypothetical protein [Longimicrobium terrae]MBB4634990.1 hypothetical protein [Longimicrobium terrae]MBB6069384.1 hypothetical protein [Longimicrobium terrae]NNC31810.1 hypothetical protein [Longimicrobium terrae]